MKRIVALASALLAMSVVAAGCASGGESEVNAGAEVTPDSRSVTVDDPIYLPSALPPDIGEESVTVTPTASGYRLVATVGPATYTLEVAGLKMGQVDVAPTTIAAGRSNHPVDNAGNIRFTDSIADVVITAQGSKRPVGSATSIIADGLVVVSRKVFDEFAKDPGSLQVVDLEPMAFVDSDVSLTQALTGRLGHVKLRVVDPRESVTFPICFGCNAPTWLTGWLSDATTHTLITTPRSTIVNLPENATMEKLFSPLLGTEVALLSTTSKEKVQVPVQFDGDSGTEERVFAIMETEL